MGGVSHPAPDASTTLRFARHDNTDSVLWSVRTGFSLVELLLVVAIIVLIGSVGSGMYANTYKKLLVQKAAKQFLLTARYARIAAIEQGRAYELMMDTANGKFFLMTTLMDEDTGESQRTPVRDYYCKPVDLEGEVKFEDVEVTTFLAAPTSDEGQERKITFLPTGATESAVVQIGDGTWHYTIVLMAATGQATLSEGTAEQVRTTMVDLDAEQ
jgi:prepilin-type N-terminal cleavage/methylation domain-containing protein